MDGESLGGCDRCGAKNVGYCAVFKHYVCDFCHAEIHGVGFFVRAERDLLSIVLSPRFD